MRGLIHENVCPPIYIAHLTHNRILSQTSNHCYLTPSMLLLTLITV